jgi:hypothetical protein
MAQRITTESEQHRAAFAYYLELGPERSLQAVARKFGVSNTAVKNWARSFHWTRRLAEHEAAVARRTIDIADSQGVETDAKARARNLKMVQMAMLKLAQALASGEVKFQLADLERMVRLETLLTEGPDAGGKGQPVGPAIDADIADMTKEELWAAMAEEMAAIRRIADWDEEVGQWVADGKVRPLVTLDEPKRCPGCGRLYKDASDDGTPNAGGAHGGEATTH